MHFKREISTSVSDLHLNSVSASIKRLAISRDGHPEKMNLKHPGALEELHKPILTVMSSAQDDFNSKYEVVGEIGRGGFSTVYQCRARSTGTVYAVKVVDLRPLRLRERFNPARLRREVDIMKRLHHPNIIQFVDVFEDADHLMMIMEYCPGMELFDVILNRKFLQEDEARPIFAQIARALYYLHSLNILHRDVKPENILISNNRDPVTGEVVAKLLDFGLSKNAGNGSAAKTFVGTPCYVAPEVEYTSKGLGGTYSFPADCWSLGAVLYVMLVARFPEFEQDATGKVVVKLNPALWSNVSSEAKELIRGLMNTNPAARLTMTSALQHPWLGRYRATQEEISRVAVASYDLNRSLQEEEARLEILEREQARLAHHEQRQLLHQHQPLNHIGEVDDHMSADVEISASGVPVHQQAMVVRIGNAMEVSNGANKGNGATGEQLPVQLAPLLHLQRSIAECFEEVHASYKDLPDLASDIRRGATLCREQLTESTKMLRKVEQTAAAVLAMFPDLELAVEEGEPQLAADFFTMVKGWVAELREMVGTTQGINKASMFQIQQVVERSAIGLMNRQKTKPSKINVPRKLLDTVIQRLGLGDKCLLENGCCITDSEHTDTEAEAATVELDANRILDLFMTLFGGAGPGNSSAPQLPGPGARSNGTPAPIGRVYSIDSDTNSLGSSTPDPPSSKQSSHEAGFNAGGGNGVGGIHNGAAATAHSVFRFNSQQTGSTNKSGVTLPSHDGTISLHREDSLGGTGKASGTTQDRRSRAGTEEVGGMGMMVDSPDDRQDSSDSTISLDTTPRVGQNREVTNYKPLRLQEVPDRRDDSAEVPPSPGANAAARLADALQKLRQVDEILEQLSVFWANTEVVLDLLTKKGQHAEQFIGFATKPRLMARFRERLEEYKRFWENVSMMCSNYIAGVQTTNDTQRMYGFLEAELTGSVSSLTGTPTTTSKSARGGSLSGNPASQSPAGYGPTMSPQTAAAATSVHTRPSGVSGVGAGGNPGIAGAGSAFSYASPVRN